MSRYLAECPPKAERFRHAGAVEGAATATVRLQLRGGGAFYAAGVLRHELRSVLGVRGQAAPECPVDEVRSRRARQAAACGGRELVNACAQMLGQPKVSLDPREAHARTAHALVDDRGARDVRRRREACVAPTAHPAAIAAALDLLSTSGR